MLGALAAVHHLDAGVDKPGALGQVFQPVFQRAFRQRRELVEQGKNENWRQHAHQQLKNHEGYRLHQSDELALSLPVHSSFDLPRGLGKSGRLRERSRKEQTP